MIKGGIADKVGNTYEAAWASRRLIDVLLGRASWLKFEGLGPSHAGFEFSLGLPDGSSEWHQTKRATTAGNWTIARLKEEKVLEHFRAKLDADLGATCVFVSGDAAKTLQAMSEKARIAQNATELRDDLGKGGAGPFDELRALWNVTDGTLHSWLRRCRFEQISERLIKDDLETQCAWLFGTDSSTSPPLLRAYLEGHFNEALRTERLRVDLPQSGLPTKSWNMDPTLRGEIASANRGYLNSYGDFGIGGQAIQRSESQEIVDAVLDPDGPELLLVTGAAGTGKSGVIRGTVDALADAGVVHLALRVDHNMTSPSLRSLGRTLFNRDHSPAVAVRGLAGDGHGVIIIDQIDAVSEISGRNPALRARILELIEEARHLGIRVVAGCRAFDLENDRELRRLAAQRKVRRIPVPLLEWDGEVAPILGRRSIDPGALRPEQRTLLRTPLNLSLFIEVGGNANFASTTDLFDRLIEYKERSLRERNLAWGLMQPLTTLARVMSEDAELVAPRTVLDAFPGSVDLLASEHLVQLASGRLAFFHESFFDYAFARAFVAEGRSLRDYLSSGTQDLFRRTQVRQILAAYRVRGSTAAYGRQLGECLGDSSIRFHIKDAVCRWLNTLDEIMPVEREAVLGLDEGNGPFPPLVWNAMAGSAAWFDRLDRDGVIARWTEADPERAERTLTWMRALAPRRGARIAEHLRAWWATDAARATKLMQWFGGLTSRSGSPEIVDLAIAVIEARPASLFERRFANPRMLDDPDGQGGTGQAGRFLHALLATWLSDHPGDQPFRRDGLIDVDDQALKTLAERAPETLLAATLDALRESIVRVAGDPIKAREFTVRRAHRSRLGGDALVSNLAAALRTTAVKDESAADAFVGGIDANAHPAFAHLHLEAIAANPARNAHRLPALLGSPFLLKAGLEGIGWKSFADAAAAAFSILSAAERDRVEEHVLGIWHGRALAGQLARELKADGPSRWASPERVLRVVRQSGQVQWAILTTIGQERLSPTARRRWQELERKYADDGLPEASTTMVGRARPPLDADTAAHLSDTDWRAIMAKYDGDGTTYRHPRSFVGGADSQAMVLAAIARKEPDRFGSLFLQLPATVAFEYPSALLRVFGEDNSVPSTIADVVIAAHAWPDRPFGREIGRIFATSPRIADAPGLFDILAFYIREGGAQEDPAIDQEIADRETVDLDQILGGREGLRIAGSNGVRGMAIEALASVAGELPHLLDLVTSLLQERMAAEALVSVRSCMPQVIYSVLVHDHDRAARLLWLLVAGTTWRRPSRLRSVAYRLDLELRSFAGYRRSGATKRLRGIGQLPPRALAPLTTSAGYSIMGNLVMGSSHVEQELTLQLLDSDDETAQAIGAFLTMRDSYRRPERVRYARTLAGLSLMNRRLAVRIAAAHLTSEEHRARAEPEVLAWFQDANPAVRIEAADIFREIEGKDVDRFRGIIKGFIRSPAFVGHGFAVLDLLSRAEADVGDLVILAGRQILAQEFNASGQDGLDFHAYHDLLFKEYARSEGNRVVREQLLDIIDDMLTSDPYGVTEGISAHDR